jgi:hypothetical protein
MFVFPQIRGAQRALGVYRLPDDLPYVDLDDAQTLVERGMRPTQVIERNRPYTQGKALEIYQEKQWSGIRWWSFHRPQWRVWCLWDIHPACEAVEDLDACRRSRRRPDPCQADPGAVMDRFSPAFSLTIVHVIAARIPPAEVRGPRLPGVAF